jgi:signal transduction histidine kinase
MFALSDTRRIYYSMMPVQINGKTQNLLTTFQIEFWNDQIKQAFYKILLIFFLACEVLAFLISLHKNKINKLAYQYEDYQRALTNNLAHDLKTPLMAIQGYAENLLNTCKMEEEPKQYLKSIIENVSYTDSLINHTLELNKMQEIKRENIYGTACQFNYNCIDISRYRRLSYPLSYPSIHAIGHKLPLQHSRRIQKHSGRLHFSLHHLQRISIIIQIMRARPCHRQGQSIAILTSGTSCPLQELGLRRRHATQDDR